MARNELLFSSSATNNVISSYHKHKKLTLDNDCKKRRIGKWPKCNKEYHLFKLFKRMNQWNKKPFTTALLKRKKRRCPSK